MTYIDTHAHLSDKAFDSDRATLVPELFKGGAAFIFEILCSEEDWDKTGLFSVHPENFYFAFGMHPEYSAMKAEDFLPRLKKHLAEPKALFLGEIGLDYWWDNAHKKEQAEILLRQLEVSSQLSKPCVFHCRDGRAPAADSAYSDLYSFLVKNWKYENKRNRRGIIHSFAGDYETAKKYLDLGLFLGINGTFTYPKNLALREAVKKAGLENIVFETDCPYLPPQSMRGRRNTPSSIPEICGAVAGFLGEKVSKTEEKAYFNSLSFIE